MNTATQDLAVLIETWTGRSKHNNLNVLSARTHISYSTVHRIAKEAVDKLTLNSALAVLAVVATKDEQGAFLKAHFPAFHKQYEKNNVDRTHGKPDVKSDNAEIDEMMSEPMGFMLAQQLLSKAGVSAERVKELYGDLGVNYLSRLDEAKLLGFEGGKWKTAFDYAGSDIEGCRKQILSAVRAFNGETYDASCGMLNTVSESVSLEGARAITDELQSCLNRIRKIRDQHPGKHTFVANLVMQLADPKAAVSEGESK